MVDERRSPLGWLSIFALTFGYYALFVHYGWNEADEGVLLAQYYRTYAGEMPVRDFHIGYTPGGYYFNAGLFHLLGPTVLSLRWALALCHALAAAILFVIGRRVMPVAFACLPPLTYCAIMPFFPGEFALFNVPYPLWYGVLFMVAGLWVLLRFIEAGGIGWMIAGGLLTGICFSFKPNVGLFQLAMNGLILLVVLEPRTSADATRRDAALWWTLLLGIVSGLMIVFASQATARDVAIFLLPIFAVVAVLAGRRMRLGATHQPPHRLLPCALAFGAAMLVPILPWALYFLFELGPEWFARALLFIGSGFERFYYIEFHRAGPWDGALVVATLGLVVLGLLVRRGKVPPALVVGAAVLVGAGVLVALGRAPMPEGLHAAVVSRVEDLSFSASLVVHWLALAACVPLLWSNDRSRRELVELAILLGAIVMYLKLYPRSDFPHLVVAVPLTLVLGAGLAARFTRWLPRTVGLRRLAEVAVVVGVLGFVLLRIAPNLATVVMWEGGPGWRPHASLDLERAPLTLELGREPRVRALHDTVEFVRANSAPGDRLFTFPAIEALCFLSDRTNATRHGYFFTGWPGHEVEAEVVSALAASPPPFVVALQRHQLFFLNAPAYYFALRAFVREHYREVARFGTYAVLAHRTIPEASLVWPPAAPSRSAALLAARYGPRLGAEPSVRVAAATALAAERLEFAWEPAVALLADDDPAVREAAIVALGSVTDRAIALPFAEALLDGRVPTRLRLAVLRRVLAAGDAGVAGEVTELLSAAPDMREYATVLLTLDTLGLKLALRDYWFGATRPIELPPGPLHDVARWEPRLLNSGEEKTLRMFLTRVLSRIDPGALAPTLCRLLAAHVPVELRVAAAEGLLRLSPADRPCDPFDTLLAVANLEPVFAPSLVLQRYREDVVAAGPRLQRALEDETLDAELVWVAAATGDARFRDAFVRRLVDSRREVRLAALTGIERLADPAVAAELRAVAANDVDHEVRATAVRALATLDRKAVAGG